MACASGPLALTTSPAAGELLDNAAGLLGCRGGNRAGGHWATPASASEMNESSHALGTMMRRPNRW
jgi:hypothetical protein